MKPKTLVLILATSSVLLLQGCIAFPPIIQVEHKESPQQQTNQEVLRKLDDIDRRLKNLEQKEDKSSVSQTK